jgi:hypothetical protein
MTTFSISLARTRPNIGSGLARGYRITVSRRLISGLKRPACISLNRRRLTPYFQAPVQLAPKLVVIDTYHAATEGSQENDNGQIGLILGQLATDCLTRSKCAVFIVHHFDKGGNWERGGSALKAGCVQALRLFRRGRRSTAHF